ncbi:SET domain-containing protein-lysine N-methyltransferase [Polaromonas sp.]|uniref:SET domain-containing protein n=1 Tax=Polaromonas sp. TaxID=1869339 RepID=UPI00286BD5C9|nr:SET domain-containing protein-lysine N-methyltransferase [Polaromonas sp.]
MHELTIPKKHAVSKTLAFAPLFAPVPAATPVAVAVDTPRPAGDGRRIQTRRSGVHGKGVFALQDLAEGETLIEYVGEVVTWKEALRRHPHDASDPNHTFYFHIDEKHVIDAKFGGNSSRWINHSCQPNCEADEDDGRVFIKALRNIAAGEELFYDYGLIIDAKYTRKLKAEYPCWCGAPDCRGTLLAPKDKEKAKAGKKDKAKAKVKAKAKDKKKKKKD